MPAGQPARAVWLAVEGLPACTPGAASAAARQQRRQAARPAPGLIALGGICVHTADARTWAGQQRVRGRQRTHWLRVSREGIRARPHSSRKLLGCTLPSSTVPLGTLSPAAAGDGTGDAPLRWHTPPDMFCSPGEPGCLSSTNSMVLLSLTDIPAPKGSRRPSTIYHALLRLCAQLFST